MNICEAYAALLDPFVDGELSPEEMGRVREHLEGCPACRAYVDDALAIRAAFPGAEDTEVPEGFAGAVSAAIRAAAPGKERRAPWVRALAPLAACCAIVILLSQGPIFRGGSGSAATNGAAFDTSGGSAAPSASSGGGDLGADGAAPEEAEYDFAARENRSLESSSQKYADLPQAVTDQNADLEESAPVDPYYAYGQIDAAAGAVEPVAPKAPPEEPAEGGAAPDGGDGVFAAVACLTKDEAGDALAEYQGNPYSRDGVAGTGYALERADFERILEALGQPVQASPDPNRTTELCCIVITD